MRPTSRPVELAGALREAVSPALDDAAWAGEAPPGRAYAPIWVAPFHAVYCPHARPAPRANPLLLGHAAAEATILDSLRTGRMHHAWLITDPLGVAKATLAFRFARRLLAGLRARAYPLEADTRMA
jgi:hypothetical protein